MFMKLQDSAQYPYGLKQTVGSVFRDLWEHPVEVLVKHWNWKAALLSSSIRAGIFLFTNLAAGWRAAVGATLVEFLFRPAVSGFLGSLTQAFRFAEPPWAAGLTVMVLFPTISHSIEFAVHYTHGTPKLAASMVGSIIFSAYSTLMNLYAMRHGVMVVNAPDAQPFTSDLKRMPVVFVKFLAAGPIAVYRGGRRLFRSGASL